MWGKAEQTILWVITYIPLILIMIFRFIISNKFIDINQIKFSLFNQKFILDSILIEILFVFFILLISFVLYKITISYFLSGYEKDLKPGGSGKNYSIREIKYLSVNDYSFFLLTLLLPLISLDHTSAIDLSVSLLIITYVISIYVKTDAISVCPLFFFSGRKVYKGIISEGNQEEENKNPYLRKDVVLILKEKNLRLNEKMRGAELASNVYYLKDIKKSD
ncbi:hypothetical protein CSV61_12290 [Sporosarcina sp. P3]|uniref:hypothetical protein n=1 Tax=Sporosarcina sp. P3 TaxID=2048245 RepID=UPI000C1676BE|nr:hypothetical protein [Sporosarcina sp. P3]PID20994.1 hypothetical protein CSV61_12290 [Sporosarcina sp. P3]